MGFGLFTSGPSAARPLSGGPDSRPRPAGGHLGAFSVVSNAAVGRVPPPVGGGGLPVVAPLAISPRKAPASLANFAELVAVPPVYVSVSPEVWMFGLSVVI